MNTPHYALVTGASSGIGWATAIALAQQKKSLILVARRNDKLEELKKICERDFQISALTYAFDISDEKAVLDFFQHIKDLQIDVVINNAGLALEKLPLEDYEWTDIKTMLDINIKAFTLVAQKSLPFLKATKGHIVNISSISGIESYSGGAVYCGSKAYVKMLSKSLRIDLLGTGVRVTDIAPGAVKTDFSLIRFKGDQHKAENVYKGFQPLEATNIAEAIVFSLKQPSHVNIELMVIMATAQASATHIAKT